VKIYLLTITTKHGSDHHAYATHDEAFNALDEKLRPLLYEWGYEDSEIDIMLDEGYDAQGDLPYADIEALDLEPSSRTLVRIEWALDLEDGEDYDSKVQEYTLPTLMYLSRDELDNEEIADTLSDAFGWLVQGFTKL